MVCPYSSICSACTGRNIVQNAMSVQCQSISHVETAPLVQKHLFRHFSAYSRLSGVRMQDAADGHYFRQPFYPFPSAFSLLVLLRLNPHLIKFSNK